MRSEFVPLEKVDAPEDAPAVGLVFQTIRAFAAVDEPGAEPLVTATVGGTVIPAGGLVQVYGDGGAGKTTLEIDMCIAFAIGASWLGILEPIRSLRIALVENEGPRGEFRRKLGRKLACVAPEVDVPIFVFEEPWARFTFADESHRRALGLWLTENKIDLLVVGPLSRVGMTGGGTLDDIAQFEQLLLDVRDLVDRPLAILLLHHENRAGQISGAWEGVPDTLVHVTGQGHGRTRVYWQKCRWSSQLHETTTHLVWADGETYTIADAKPEITDDTIADGILTAVRILPGGSWTKIRELLDDDGQKIVRGNLKEAGDVRDHLLAEGDLVNRAARQDRFNLWAADDPTAPRSDLGTGLERLTFPPAAEESDPCRSPVPSIEGTGNGTERTDEPQLELDNVTRPPSPPTFPASGNSSPPVREGGCP